MLRAGQHRIEVLELGHALDAPEGCVGSLGHLSGDAGEHLRHEDLIGALGASSHRLTQALGGVHLPVCAEDLVPCLLVAGGSSEQLLGHLGALRRVPLLSGD